MTLGTLRLVLYLHGCRSLKEKRAVVRKVLSRTRAKFNVAAAEVGNLDAHTKATLAFVAVANDARLVNSMMDKALNFVDQLYLAQIVDHQIELIHIAEEGS